nr:class II holin family protein [Pantoea sp. 201603H]
MSINHMSKLATGVAYGASAGTVANGLLTRLSPDEWSAVGVLAGIVVALLTFGINFYFKRKVSLAQIRALEARGYIPTDKLGEQ